jgi:hypothetical protein
MSDQSNVLSRVVRWGAVGLLMVIAIVLYFRTGVHLQPFTAANQAGTVTDTAVP